MASPSKRIDFLNVFGPTPPSFPPDFDLRQRLQLEAERRHLSSYELGHEYRLCRDAWLSSPHWRELEYVF